MKLLTYTYKEIDSTNRQAVRLAQTDALCRHHPFLVAATTQTAGKGKGERLWSSPSGNLYLSFAVWFPPFSQRHSQIQPSQLALVMAVIVSETLQTIVSPTTIIHCKWPNDVLLNQRKVCGILLEQHQLTSISSNNLLVIGVGINVYSCPDTSTFPAICLQECWRQSLTVQTLRQQLALKFQKHYPQWLQYGFESYRQAWQQLGYRLNETVTITNFDASNTVKNGVFRGIDTTGAALIEIDHTLTTFLSVDIR